MNGSTKAHIFDIFSKGDTSHSKSGNGLGPPMIKRIVDLCSGEIMVQSEPETVVYSLSRFIQKGDNAFHYFVIS